MYALVEIKGKQYKAVEGETLQVDLLNMEEGASYETDKVLAVVDGENAVRYSIRSRCKGCCNCRQ